MKILLKTLLLILFSFSLKAETYDQCMERLLVTAAYKEFGQLENSFESFVEKCEQVKLLPNTESGKQERLQKLTEIIKTFSQNGCSEINRKKSLFIFNKKINDFITKKHREDVANCVLNSDDHEINNCINSIKTDNESSRIYCSGKFLDLVEHINFELQNPGNLIIFDDEAKNTHFSGHGTASSIIVIAPWSYKHVTIEGDSKVYYLKVKDWKPCYSIDNSDGCIGI